MTDLDKLKRACKGCDALLVPTKQLLAVIDRLEKAEGAAQPSSVLKKLLAPITEDIQGMAFETANDLGCANQEGAPVSETAKAKCDAWFDLLTFIDPAWQARTASRALGERDD